jgi:endonuclease-3
LSSFTSPADLSVPRSYDIEPGQAQPDSGFVKLVLRRRFGIPDPPKSRPPLNELVLTILSQNTNDTNRDRAFASLRTRFPEWKDVLKSSPEELERTIAPAGLGYTKSRRIWAILEAALVTKEIVFDDFCSLPRQELLDCLLSLDGVGPKTAACVLLFSCGVPAFPVDTHVYRVCGRLGLLPGGADRVKAHDLLELFFNEEDYLEIHLNIIKLGRQTCRPRRPLCGECPFEKVCPASVGAEE